MDPELQDAVPHEWVFDRFARSTPFFDIRVERCVRFALPLAAGVMIWLFANTSWGSFIIIPILLTAIIPVYNYSTAFNSCLDFLWAFVASALILTAAFAFLEFTWPLPEAVPHSAAWAFFGISWAGAVLVAGPLLCTKAGHGPGCQLLIVMEEAVAGALPVVYITGTATGQTAAQWTGQTVNNVIGVGISLGLMTAVWIFLPPLRIARVQAHAAMSEIFVSLGQLYAQVLPPRPGADRAPSSEGWARLGHAIRRSYRWSRFCWVSYATFW